MPNHIAGRDAMATTKDIDSAMDVSNGEKYESNGAQQNTGLKRSAAGIILVPQPSSDLADPLNWPMWRKIIILAIVSLSGFIGIAQATANQGGFLFQAALYHKTPVEISYGVCWTVSSGVTHR